MDEQTQTLNDVPQEIRGEIGFLADKHLLSDGARSDLYKIFCNQARLRDIQLEECARRITNQRIEIARLSGRANAHTDI